MIHSIQHFEEKGIQNLEKIIENFFSHPTDMAALVSGIQNELLSFALELIGETLTDCNQMLKDSAKRRNSWRIVRTDQKQLITSLGTVTFSKTLFQHKKNQKREYLLDRILALAPHERMTEDAKARLLEEAVQTSYQKAGKATSLSDTISKQSVKNKIHALRFPEVVENAKEKKQVRFLYLDADEDHVALQFLEKKGDLLCGKRGIKNNGVLAKLVYVYEGKEEDEANGNRPKLMHPHYFSGVYEGKKNQKLWREVYDYLDRHYDMEYVEKIYLNSDGGGWIKAGKTACAKVIPVLDEFHLEKYIRKANSHQGEQKEEEAELLRELLREGKKKEFIQTIEQRIEKEASESRKKRIEGSKKYLHSNWDAARVRVQRGNEVCGSSTESHVSHVLSERLSSRPMGWSRIGVDKMCHLRAYYWNGGEMLELVRMQKEEMERLPEEEPVLSHEELRKSTKNRHGELGKYMESIHHSLSNQAKKLIWFNSHIWGL